MGIKNRVGTLGYIVSLMLLLASCKSTKTISEGTLDHSLSAKSVIRAHYQNEAQFNTLAGKVKIDYSDAENSQSVTVTLRMEKDKAIWLSAPFGVVKAYITPDRVSFYNKLESEYFDGDFGYLSGLLETEVDFSILQNLLLGEALIDLRKEKYELSIADNGYRLIPKMAGTLYKSLFQIDPVHYKMAIQQLSQPIEKKLLEIKYQNYQKVGSQQLPDQIYVRAIDNDEENTIKLEYKNLELNQPVNFPYKIPNGFKEIVLK